MWFVGIDLSKLVLKKQRLKSHGCDLFLTAQFGGLGGNYITNGNSIDRHFVNFMTLGLS